MKHCIKLCIISCLAIFIHGYQYAVSDQEIFIPYILKSANQSLFPEDALFNQSSAHLSFFYPVAGMLIRFMDIQIVFFIGYLIFQFSFFAGLYRLSKILLKNEQLAYFSLLPFLLPKFIGGTATQTFDLFFGYRSVGLVFLIFYFIYLFEKKYNKAAAIAAIGVWFHPLSILPSILLIPALTIAENTPPQRFKVLLSSFAVFALLICPFILFSKTNGLSIFKNIFDANWWSIIKSRNDYLFISSWSITAWAALGIYLAPIVLFHKNLVKRHQHTLKLIIIMSFIVFLINAFALEVLKIPVVAQFQLVRAIAPLAYIGLIMAVYFLSSKNRWQQALGFLAIIALSSNAFVPFMVLTALYVTSLIVISKVDNSSLKVNIVFFTLSFVMVIFLFVFINKIDIQKIGNRIQFPKAGSDWIEVQKWAKKNTSNNDIFLVPPNRTGFRVFSERPILGDIKDGAVTIYSKNYATYWYVFMKNTSNYENLEETDFQGLKNKYNFDYIVTLYRDNLNFEVVHKTGAYTIYKI